MIFRKLIIAIAATACFFAIAHAQPIQQSANETGLALEVVYLKGRPPAYQPVTRSKSRKGGAWYALFGRIAGWQLPDGALPINAVRLVPYLKGEIINISVSVMRGRFLDVEDRVASYQARENEEITVRELRAFGVAPFAIKVVRNFVNSSDFPTSLNKTKSVAVVGIEPVVGTVPRYKLMLHNLSEKNISALSINIVGQGRLRKSSLPHGDYGEPLIKARDSGYLNESLALNAEATIGGYEPSSPPGQQIVIESLVFEDGSYEGELKPAGTFLGFVVGRRIELRRILPLLDSALSASDPTAASTLSSQLSSLSYEPDEAEVVSLLAAFPTLEKHELRGSVEVAIHGVRKELLDQLERLQGPKSNADDFKAWLVRTRKLYSNWLSYLNAADISQR
jgi:hypothetical protein